MKKTYSEKEFSVAVEKMKKMSGDTFVLEENDYEAYRHYCKDLTSENLLFRGVKVIKHDRK